ncbi:GNAT family N-acetyltransferase [Roseibium sp. MMSF_3412]|uniref:GNAT family N-acetyltransferase n=1 Tax=Roseibium sp. MMSF_3412 TaxID=3046712 RepID=UPI00273D6E63|nr:GNAT family N-acetyltransferase [Roseibium sp. MMSF_3412]
MSLSSGPVPESSRLSFRPPKVEDASFYNTLMNEPDYHRFIADRGIRSDADAAAFIETKTLAHFAEHKVGLWLVEQKETGAPIGACGLVVRDDLDVPDLGYAFLEEARGKGYAREAAKAVLDFVRENMDLPMICAITHTENHRSSSLLLKLGFTAKGQRYLAAYDDTSDYFEFDFNRDRA